MMRSIVNNHSRVLVSGESHYFDDLRVRMSDVVQAALSDEQQKECEDYFLALDHRPYGHRGDPEKSDTSREDIRATAAQRGDGADSYFEAFCILRAQRAGKEIWGDKTPRHVFRIPEILSRYPDGKVICMVRDPRAVVASYRDWRNQGGFDLEKDPEHAEALRAEQERARKSYNILIISLLWRSTVRAAVAAQDQFGADRVFIQQYEELVENPEGAIRSVADWLELGYEPAMLEVPMHNSSFSQFDKESGVSTEPVRRWKKRLSAAEIAVVQSCCGSLMQRAGYEKERVPASRLRVACEWIRLPFASLRAATANRDRMGNMPQYIWRRLRLAMGR
jgi:hypothetical protein